MLALNCVHSASDRLVEGLPQRLLYAGECIRIQLVGLQLSRSLLRYRPVARILVLVAFGQIHLNAPETFRVLIEGDGFELDPACEYDLSTDHIADLLLITLPKKQHSSLNSRASCESSRRDSAIGSEFVRQ